MHIFWWFVLIVGIILIVAPGVALYVNAKRKWR